MGFPMISMNEALKRSSVQVVDSIDSWEDAISYSVSPLVEDGYAEPCYIDNIIGNAKEFGPYFVLCPDLALLHARPEQGAIKTQLGVTVVSQGVTFKEGEEPVRVLVTLVATDGDAHLDVMRVLAMMFSDPQVISGLAEADDADVIYNTFIEAAEKVSIN